MDVYGEEHVPLLLALLNSRPVLDGVEQDALAQFASAKTWLREHDQPPTRDGWKSTLSVRDSLRDVVRGEREPRVLGAFVRGVDWRPHVAEQGIAWQPRLPRGGETAARAVLAWDHLCTTSPGRLRPCTNAECQLFFLDRSKANSARWCSMAVCGNRMKARRHYDRTRSASQ